MQNFNSSVLKYEQKNFLQGKLKTDNKTSNILYIYILKSYKNKIYYVRERNELKIKLGKNKFNVLKIIIIIICLFYLVYYKENIIELLFLLLYHKY